MQPAQRVLITGIELGADPVPILSDIDLHPLVVVGEPMLGDQPLIESPTL
jgi:hypothetical protein